MLILNILSIFIFHPDPGSDIVKYSYLMQIDLSNLRYEEGVIIFISTLIEQN